MKTSASKRGKIVLLVGLAIALASVIVARHWIQSQIILYHPDLFLPSPDESGASTMKPVKITTKEGLELTSWYAAPTDDTKPVILFFMGDTGSLADRAAEFHPYLDQGYGFMLLGYRGFGGNPGVPSERGLYRDARAALLWLKAQGYPDNRVVLYGHSLGTGIAVQVATEIMPFAVVLEAPYTSLADTVELHIPILNPHWFMKDRYDNLSKIAKIKAPLLILQGEEDEVISNRQGKTLFKAASAPKVGTFIPHGGHSNLYDYGAADVIMGFLEHLPSVKLEQPSSNP